MSNLRFSEKDGISYVHVTSITQFYPKPWKEMWQRKVGFEEADKKSEAATTFGKEVNRLIDLDIKGESFEYPNERFQKASEFARHWREDLKVKNIETQKELFHPKKLYCGVPDVIGKRNNKFLLADWKSGQNQGGEHELQVGAYYGLCKVNGIDVKKAWLVYLEQGKANCYGVFELNYFYRLFLKQLSLFRHYQKWEEKNGNL